MGDPNAPAVILGAGYAGVKLAHELSRRANGAVPIVLVDRHPVHVVRTELYEVGALASRGNDVRRWAIPIEKVVGRRGVAYREGSVDAIDLDATTVTVAGERVPYGSLAICLGNVPAFFGVPGAASEMHQVYGLIGAMRLASAMREVEAASPRLPLGQRPRVVVVGGGSTGTEVGAEIATADWRRIADPAARPPQVTLVCGALPFLAGLDPNLIEHARRLLYEAGVVINEGTNVKEVGHGVATLEDGNSIPFDVGVWAAGVEAPALVKGLPVPHGKGGRIQVEPTLEVPAHPGVFGVGDVVELTDPTTGVIVPATAQAALAEAPVAAENIMRRRAGQPLLPFRYRERGAIVAVGHGRGAARWNRVTLWGSPASILKSIVQKEYRLASELGREPPAL